MIKIFIGIGLIALFVVIRYLHKRNYYICLNARKVQNNEKNERNGSN